MKKLMSSVSLGWIVTLLLHSFTIQQTVWMCRHPNEQRKERKKMNAQASSLAIRLWLETLSLSPCQAKIPNMDKSLAVGTSSACRNDASEEWTNVTDRRWRHRGFCAPHTCCTTGIARNPISFSLGFFLSLSFSHSLSLAVLAC